jgi:phage tail-like protein
MSFGASRQLHTRHKFLVQTQKFGTAAFQKCSEISWEIAKIEYWEGGADIPIKTRGRVTVADVTLEKGTSQSTHMNDWAIETVKMWASGPAGMIGGKGLPFPNFKTDDISVETRDLDNSLLREWNLIGAFPIKYVAGAWDNTVDEVVIEQLTLAYDYPKLKQ